MIGAPDLWRLGVAELGGAFARGQVSPVTALETCLARIERLNPTLNAVVTLNPAALEEACASERRHRQGEARGPLDGVPLTVKDLREIYAWVDLAQSVVAAIIPSDSGGLGDWDVPARADSPCSA